MKQVLITSLAALAVSSGYSQAANQARKPNILIIYTDDQGSIDVNCYGSKDLVTLNMDKLAETGVKFTQFYAAAAVSSPSRAALLTGLSPLAAEMPGNGPAWHGFDGMPSKKITIAETLKENGYVTGHVGKWHLGYSDATMPNGQGFDYSFGFMGGCIDNYSHYFYWGGPNQHDLWENGKEIWREGQYFPEMITSKAVDFMEQNKDTTFFLYYAINNPHYPLQGTAKWREYYKDLKSPRNKYAACVSTIDDQIGVLLKKLDELHLRENTIIIFQSDQGHSTEDRAFGGGGNAGIYRGGKESFFEGGIRIPAMISWPGKIPQNVTRDQWCMNVDWFPTILDFCGINYSENAFEGKTMKRVILKNAKATHDTFCWYFLKNNWAVRKGDWKLLVGQHDPSKKAPMEKKDSIFLVNVTQNPEEMVNVADQYPDKVKELTKDYYDWYNKVMAENAKK